MTEEEKQKKTSFLGMSVLAFVFAVVFIFAIPYAVEWLNPAPTRGYQVPQLELPEGIETLEQLYPEPEEDGTRVTEKVEQGGERPEMLVLTPQQLAQANEMLAAFEGKPLNELIQVYGVMQMAAVSVSPEDRPVFDFVLAKLGVYIAELER